MTVTETMPADPSALRALALSTLKSRRKKPAVAQPVKAFPPRPIPRPAPTVDSMQLDYGDVDPYATPQPTFETSMDVDRPFNLEDGEISGGDAASKRQSSRTSSAEVSMEITKSESQTPSPSPETAPTTRLSLFDRITDASAQLVSISHPGQALSERISSPTASNPTKVIHVHQVRPNVPCE